MGAVGAPNWAALYDRIMVDQLRPDADQEVVVAKIGVAGPLEDPAMETSVTEDDALHIKQGSEWQPLLEFLIPGGVAGEDQAVRRITEAVGELDLESAQKAQIEGSVVEALREAVQRDMHHQPNLSVSIRVWVLGLSTAEAGSSSVARRVGPEKRRGWGFFLLQRQESDPPPGQVDPHRVIELYLYQETARVK